MRENHSNNPILLPIPHIEWKASLTCKGIFCISDDFINADGIQLNDCNRMNKIQRPVNILLHNTFKYRKCKSTILSHLSYLSTILSNAM